jgi:hypothetical protein
MSNSLFDQNGLLNLDEVVASSASFQKIMEDGIVTNEEIQEQASEVVNLLHQLEAICTEEQLRLIRKTLAELGVLFAVYQQKQIQDIQF